MPEPRAIPGRPGARPGAPAPSPAPSPSVPPPGGRRPRPGLVLALLPLLAAAAPYAFSGGSTRRWFGGGRDTQRARAQEAKDAAATAFYELDSAQRDLRISVETVTAVDESPPARRAAADFEALGRRIDEVSHTYITAVDAHDLDRDDLDSSTASRARADLDRASEELRRTKAELDRFAESLTPLLDAAETQLARLAPAVERARQALLAATRELDTVRASGLRADDLAARLAALSPDLTKLNEGAGRHGLRETLRRADELLRAAEGIRSEAAQLPGRAAEIDRRLVTLRTRAEAITTRTEGVGPVLSELRRRYSAACWQDLQRVPDEAAAAVAQAEEKLREAREARREQRWPDALARLGTVRTLLDGADEDVTAAGDRLRRLDEVSADPSKETERTRFAIRDAQRLAMAGRATPDPRHARPLDDAVARLDRAVAELEGRHPDWWRFLTETEAVRRSVARVVTDIREDLGAGR
ncbi:hypothetical protein [Streptomyces zingiberis]|uniref:Septation ring formation regulator EzrA n=1 Tax=Streptomyces zingiberis TaxID=2053010 RepID=A0ABX1BTM9_9ACTN|nr:hypothetical protein [Streptomyces zingiberis]NJP99567.1 hypothetical protein [Streptomyces zingiberis]